MKENLIAGLVSGLFVMIIVLVCRNFWSFVIVPWFEERVYKDVQIEGKWFGLYPTTVDLRQDIIILKRHGHAITGKIICIKGDDEGEEYNICGSFRNLLLPLIYESTDKMTTDRGTITLKSIRNGTRLSGKIALYQSSKDAIDSGNILWFRSKEDLDKTMVNIKNQKDELKRIMVDKKRIAEKEAEIENIDKDNKKSIGLEEKEQRPEFPISSPDTTQK